MLLGLLRNAAIPTDTALYECTKFTDDALVPDEKRVRRTLWELKEVGFHHVLLEHSLRIKKRAVEGDAVPHDLDEPVPVERNQWNDNVFQLPV